MERLREHLLKNPADGHAWLLLGEELTSLGEEDEALTCFEKALELDPENYRALARALEA